MIMKKAMSPMCRKIGMFALAGVMAMSPLAMPAMAIEGETGGGSSIEKTVPSSLDVTLKTADNTDATGPRKLTVEKVNPGASYKFYKLLDLDATPNKEENGVVSYLYKIPVGKDARSIATAVKEVLDANAGLKYNSDPKTGHMGFELNGSTENGWVVVFQKPVVDETNETEVGRQRKDEKELMFKFADAMRDKISTGNLDYDLKADGPFEVAVEGSIIFSGLDDGYWMVTTDAGVRSIVFTNPSEGYGDMTMENKNPLPTLTKEVWDNDDTVTAKGEGDDRTFEINYRECTDPSCTAGHTLIDKTTKQVAPEGSVEGGNIVKAHIGKYEADNDIGINDKTTFKIDVDAKSGVRHLVVTDTLDAGLEFGTELDSVIFYPRVDADTLGRTVKIDGGESARIELYREGSEKATAAGRSEYTLDKKTVDGKTQLVISFKPEFLNPVESDTSAMAKVYKGDLSTIDDDGGKIEIIYTVELKGGVDKDTAQKKAFENTAVLTYGASDNVEELLTSSTAKTTTYTYELDLLKFVKGSETSVLPGAKFVLYRVPFNVNDSNFEDGKVDLSDADEKITEATTTFQAWVNAKDKGTDTDAKDLPDNWKDYKGVMYFTQVQTGDKDKASIYVPVVSDGETCPAGAIREIVTPESGKVLIKGLDAGLYAFGETEAPKGYNRLEAPTLAVIGDTVAGNGGKVFAPKNAGDTTFLPLENDSIEVKIANASGGRLPSTGGIGVVPFYVAGGVLVVGAGTLMVVRKRREDGGDEG